MALVKVVLSFLRVRGLSYWCAWLGAWALVPGLEVGLVRVARHDYGDNRP